MPAFNITINSVDYRVHKARYQNKDNGIQVREALDLSSDVEVAIKFLPWPSSSSKAAKFHRFLMDEINAMKALRQVNGDFVQLLNYEEKLHHNGSDWAVIVMPLYWGSLKSLNLKRLAADDKDKECSNLLERLAVAIQIMHSRNVVHRDLKLANICIDRHFNPYVVDFGHAILCSPNQQLEEYPIGTRGCRCPEYVRTYAKIKNGEKPTNREYNAEKFDVFSLGVIFFQILSGGSHPFVRAELEDNRYTFLMKNDTQTWWELQDLKCKRSIPRRARTLIEGMLCADPNNRFTIDQVLQHSYFNAESSEMDTIEIPRPRFGNSSSGHSNHSSENVSTMSTSALPSTSTNSPSTSTARPCYLRPCLSNQSSKTNSNSSKVSKASIMGRKFLNFVGFKKEKNAPVE